MTISFFFGSRLKHNNAHDGNSVLPSGRDSVETQSLDAHYSRLNTPDTNRPLRTSSLYALDSQHTSSVLSMSSMGSGASSSTRSHRPRSPVSMYVPTEYGAPTPRRPRSPVSMYVPTESRSTKPPRPLAKLDKTPKTPSTSSTFSSLSSPTSSPAESPSASLHRHPTRSKSRSSLSIGPLLKRVSLRRKSSAVASDESHAASLSPPDTPTISPLQKRLRQLDKVTRTLGGGFPTELILGDGAPTPERPETSPATPFLATSPTTKLARSRSTDARSRSKVPEPWLAQAPPSKNPHHPKRRESLSRSYQTPLSPDDDASHTDSATHTRGDSSASHASSSQQSNSAGSKSSFAVPDLSREDIDGESTSSGTLPRISTCSDVVFRPLDDDDPSPISFGPPSPMYLSRGGSDNQIIITDVDDEDSPITLLPPPRKTRTHTPKPSLSDTLLLHPPRAETPFVQNLVNDSDAFVEVHDTMGKPSRRERRQGWSGEWNRQDMQDVITKLRMLR